MLIRLLLRFVPWWIWGLLAMALLTLMTIAGMGHLKLRDEVSVARLAPPVPEPLQNATIVPGTHNPLREFDTMGVVTDLGRFSEQGVGWLWVLFGPENGPGASMVLILGESGAGDDFAMFSRFRATGATVAMRGFLVEDRENRRRVTQFLQLRGTEVPQLFGMTDGLFTDREAEFDRKLRNSLIGLFLIAIVTFTVTALAVKRYRRWLRSVRESGMRRSAPYPERPGRRTASGREIQPVSADGLAADRFANSPISSRPRGIFGWFSR